MTAINGLDPNNFNRTLLGVADQAPRLGQRWTAGRLGILLRTLRHARPLDRASLGG